MALYLLIKRGQKQDMNSLRDLKRAKSGNIKTLKEDKRTRATQKGGTLQKFKNEAEKVQQVKSQQTPQKAKTSPKTNEKRNNEQQHTTPKRDTKTKTKQATQGKTQKSYI